MLNCSSLLNNNSNTDIIIILKLSYMCVCERQRWDNTKKNNCLMLLGTKIGRVKENIQKTKGIKLTTLEGQIWTGKTNTVLAVLPPDEVA